MELGRNVGIGMKHAVRQSEHVDCDQVAADRSARYPDVSRCPFCTETLKISSSPFDTVLAEGPGVRLVPALGMLVPGYFLVATHDHVLAFAELDAAALAGVWSWVTSVTRSLAAEFGGYFVFEHGSCSSAASGACIDHAHLHLVPLADRVGSELLRSASWREFVDDESLVRLRGQAYAYLGIDDRHFFVLEPDFPSQWLRRKIGEELQTDQWDWALDDGADALVETFARIRHLRFAGRLGRDPRRTLHQRFGDGIRR